MVEVVIYQDYGYDTECTDAILAFPTRQAEVQYLYQHAYFWHDGALWTNGTTWAEVLDG